MTTDSQPQKSEKDPLYTTYDQTFKRHRRDLRRYVWLPILACVLLISLVVIGALSLGRAGTSGVADMMLSFLCLLPLIVCLFPLYLVLIVTVVYLGRLKSPIHNGLSGAQQRTSGLSSRTKSVSESASKRVANLSVKLASLNAIFDYFERAGSKHEETGNSET